MKMILKGACIVAVLALAFTSCKKKENNAHSIFVSTQPVEISDGERAYVDPTNSRIYFEQGDQVMLYNIDYAGGPRSYYGVYTTRETGYENVEFDYQSGPIIDHMGKADAFFAFYPGQRVNNAYLSQNNMGIFDIANHQTYREINGQGVYAERTWAMAAKTEDYAAIDQAHFTFQNIMGGVNFKLSTNQPNKVVSSIVFEDNIFNIAGDVHLKIDEVDPVEMTWLCNNYNPNNATYMQRLNDYIDAVGYFVDGDQKGKTITLDCGEGVALTSTPKSFYIVLRPLAMYGGFTATVNFTDGSHAVIATTYPNTVRPNVIKRFTLNIDNFMVP